MTNTVYPFSNFYVTSYTFTDNTVQRIEKNANITLSSVNIHVYNADLKYGNSKELTGLIRANAVVWFDAPVRPYDLLFQNNTAGSNGTVVIIGPIKE